MSYIAYKYDSRAALSIVKDQIAHALGAGGDSNSFAPRRL